MSKRCIIKQSKAKGDRRVKRRKRIIALCSAIALTVGLAIWIAWGNTAIEVNTYTYENAEIPDEFSGFRIAQISDFHDAEIGKDNIKLINALKESDPDIIVITGDFIDSRRTDVEHSLAFAREAVKIAPCYYVTGNHEGRTSAYISLRDGLVEIGVNVLENESVEIEKDGKTITLVGVHDQNLGFSADIVAEIGAIEDRFTILLAHRPVTFSFAANSGIDLMLSGHNHGGQFRLPFVGGVFAPNQGFFPEYDAGAYVEGNSTMIISRGIGNSRFPFRVNNRPEIVLVELSPEK